MNTLISDDTAATITVPAHWAVLKRLLPLDENGAPSDDACVMYAHLADGSDEWCLVIFHTNKTATQWREILLGKARVGSELQAVTRRYPSFTAHHYFAQQKDYVLYARVKSDFTMPPDAAFAKIVRSFTVR